MTTFPSERFQAGWAAVRLFAALVIVCLAQIQSPSIAVGQGETEESESVTNGSPSSVTKGFSGITAGFGNTVRGIFGTRDSASETSPKTPKPIFQQRESGLLKPGSVRNGFAKQLKASADPATEAVIDEEGIPGGVSPVVESSKPARLAKAPYREPFSTPAPAGMTSSPPPSRGAAAAASSDPPSLVGTGVKPSRESNAANVMKGASPINRFKPALNQTAELPPSAGQAYATRPLPEVITPAQKLSSSTNTATGSAASENISVQRQASAQAYALPGDQTNSPSKDSKTSRRKSSSTSPENSITIENDLDTTPPQRVAQKETSNDLNSRPAAEQVLDPVSKKPVPPSNRREPAGYPLSKTPAASPTDVGYDNKNSGFPLTSKQDVAPETNLPTTRAIDVANGPRIDMSIPKVRLYVSGPNALQVSKPVPYEVVIQNEGTEELSGVIVSMTVPTGVTASSFVSTAGEFESEKDENGMETVLWHVIDLGPAQSRIFRLNLEASKPEHFAIDVEWTVLPQSSQVKIAVEEPLLTLALEGPSEVLWGKPELYRLRVRNPGNAMVQNTIVKLAAETFGSNESSIGDLSPGGERVVEVELTFQQAGKIVIVGQATSKTQSLEATSNIDVAVNQIKLESEWNAPTKQYLGSVEDYQVTLHNRSNIIGTDVTCAVVIPDGLSPVNMPEGATVVGKEVRWKLPSINGLESKVFRFTVQANEAKEVKLKFDAKCAGNGANSSEANTIIEPIVDLKLTVVDPIAPAPVGQDVQYDLVILNRGSRPARAVKVVAQFSNGIEPIRAEGGLAKLIPGQVVFDAIETIGPGQQITLRVVAHATEAGVHRFRAELECEDGETQLIEEESTRYLATSRSDSSKPTVRR